MRTALTAMRLLVWDACMPYLHAHRLTRLPSAQLLGSLLVWQVLLPRFHNPISLMHPVHAGAQLRAHLLVWEPRLPRRPACRGPMHAVCTST